MAEVTIYHNPNCSTSKHAVATAAERGADAEVVQYLKTPPGESALRAIFAKLEDPITDLVRRDANWQRLGLTDADVATEDQVINVLVAHPELMQRPLLVTAERAIIGRPKDRVAAFLG